MEAHTGEALLQEDDDLQASQNRVMRRMRGYRAVISSDDYIYILCSLPASLMPQCPAPSDHCVSKRSWERQMQVWRAQLERLRREVAMD